MTRTVIAFLVAPAMVSIAMLVEWREVPINGLAFTAVFSIAFSYGGVRLFGIPLFLFLQRRQWTSFWTAAIVGGLADPVAWLCSPSRSRCCLAKGWTELGAASLTYPCCGALDGRALHWDALSPC
jgi:hypothetical protein